MSYPSQAPALKSIIQRIADELFGRIGAMRDEDDDPMWNGKMMQSIGSLGALSKPAFTLSQGNEDVKQLMHPHVEKICRFYIEFRFSPIGGVDNADQFRYYLAKLQQRLFGISSNLYITTAAGIHLATNVVEVGNAPEIESQSDPAPGGTLTFDVTYRHWQADPYHLPSEDAIYVYGQ